FSNKSANELKNRLINSSGIDIDDVEKMQVSTIHSFCYSILTEYGTGGMTILDDDLSERTNMFIRKNLYDLGFKYGSYISKRELGNIIEKFNEYGTFKVDSKGLIEYITNNYPVSREYIDFISSCIDNAYENNKPFYFPYEDVKADSDLKESWYNKKYIQIAKAYPEYLKLLDINNSIDFAHLQIKTLDLLEGNSELLKKLKYNHILVDEFQDTDPIQMKIFELLMGFADSFTVVGDDDQSIYGFRGSNIDFFTEFETNYNANVIPLKTNYRSCSNIVCFTEEFIKDIRREDSNKVLSANTTSNNINTNNGNIIINNINANNNNNHSTNVFKLINTDKEDEANNLVNIILDLKENGKINNYRDVAILFRSIGGMGKSKIEGLLNKLKENNIPFYIRGNPDLIKKDEIKIIITLIHYLIDSSKNSHILTAWEKEWLNLGAYSTLSNYGLILNETANILSNIWDNFENEVINTEKDVYYDFTGKKSRIKSFKGVFNRDEDVLLEIFKSVKKPVLSEMDLSSLGVCKKDLEFFDKLNTLKNELNSENALSEVDTLDSSDSKGNNDESNDLVSENTGIDENPNESFEEEPITLLEVFYKLLEIIGYLDEEFVLDNGNQEILENLAILTNTLYNYENIIDKSDLKGLFYFLYHNLENYSSSIVEEKDAVEIMTVHKSKGLEFPVVILGSLKDGKFPMKYKGKSEDKRSIFNMYYTPNEFLEYKKNLSVDGEELEHIKEEKRVIYVAMTRAESILILSAIEELPDVFNSMNI
ncbi:MAG: UvrD-helicase domain-containing protein, partial [Methanobacteriaceae archaeon]